MPRSLFHDLPQATAVVRPASMEIVEWNAEADRLFGALSSPVKLSERIQAWDTEKFFKALEEEKFDSPELLAVTGLTVHGTHLIDLLVSKSELRGEPVYVVVFSDAAARVRLEEQLRQAQKMESVGMLAGGIAHDFNNLLTIISGYSHMLVASLAGDENNRTFAEQVIKASDRASALTRQLLSFSRRQVAQNKVVDLNGIMQGMTPMLNRIIGEHIRLVILPGKALGHVRADAGQIEQVIMNLVVNARDAMPEGGSLRIETINAELDSQYLGRHMEARPGPYVMLAVSDSGIGMDAATKDKVFEPFFTTKADGKGTGLGLSMVYGIVKRYGGTVDVYSEPGQGTAIKIYLPRADTAENTVTAAVAKLAISGSETVLLVEDDDAVRNIVKATLETQGYRLLVAPSGEEALDIAKLHPGPIHLMITDMVLPHMNGREVARRFHKKRPDTVVLFTSGYTDISLNDAVNPGKQIHFIGKPFTPAAIAQRVRELLDARQPLKVRVPRQKAVAEDTKE